MSLLDQTEHDVEGWKPEPNEGIEGLVTLATTRNGNYGAYPYLEVNIVNASKTGLVGKIIGVHAYHTVLRNEIEEKQPRKGDEIAIRYLGKVKPKSGEGSEFEKYRVIHVPCAHPSDIPEATKEQLSSEFPGVSFDEEEPF